MPSSPTAKSSRSTERLALKIGLQTWGTEGDVRPFFSLGAELQARGHEVHVIYTNVEGREFDDLARASGVKGTSVGGDYFRKNAEHVRQQMSIIFGARDPLRVARILIRETLNPVAREMQDAAMALAEDSDVIVGHCLAHTAGTAALKRDRSLVSLAFAPFFPTAYLPPPGAPDLGRLGNPFLWWFVSRVLESALRDSINEQRARVGMKPASNLMRHALTDPDLSLVCMSPSLLAPSPDWAPHIKVSGFLAPPPSLSTWTPPTDLRAFLDAGKAPVFASFGSMFHMDDARTKASVSAMVEACALASTRMIIQAPDAITNMVAPSKNVFFVKRAPHSELFPLCSAIVHHGGAGTTQSALMARRPSVIVPHATDQGFWAANLHRHGAAAKPLSRKSLTATALAKRITAALEDEAMRARARTLGDAIAKENGVGTAAEHIEALA